MPTYPPYPPYPPIPRVLAIAASDSSGAAGMQADLKTFEARQVYGLSALTAITAQDSLAISAVSVLPADLVAQQIRAVLADGGAEAIKTGLLFRAEIVNAVAESLKPAPDRLVVDPVLVAGDGRRLVDEATIAAYRTALFPRALLITPNLDEARILTGRLVDNPDSMRAAAKLLGAMGPRYVLVKGGHLETGAIVDVLYDGQAFHEYRAERLPIANARGAGCTFAACVTAEIAKGRDVPAAVGIAKRYLTAALAAAVDWHMGRGRGTLFHSLGRPPLFEE